jgi:hypothetical protein
MLDLPGLPTTRKQSVLNPLMGHSQKHGLWEVVDEVVERGMSRSQAGEWESRRRVPVGDVWDIRFRPRSTDGSPALQDARDGVQVRLRRHKTFELQHDVRADVCQSKGFTQDQLLFTPHPPPTSSHPC